MTDTWDELWNEISIDGITQTSNISNSWVRNILNRIKVEGDNLKAKADILDRVEEMGVVTYNSLEEGDYWLVKLTHNNGDECYFVLKEVSVIHKLQSTGGTEA